MQDLESFSILGVVIALYFGNISTTEPMAEPASVLLCHSVPVSIVVYSLSRLISFCSMCSICLAWLFSSPSVDTAFVSSQSLKAGTVGL